MLKDHEKEKRQLIEEIHFLRSKLAKLETADIEEHKGKSKPSNLEQLCKRVIKDIKNGKAAEVQKIGPETARIVSELAEQRIELRQQNEELREMHKELEESHRELAIDVAAREQAERAVKKSEESLQASLDAAEIGVWDWDIAGGCITWAGHHAKLFGYEENEFDGSYAGFERCIHPEDLAGLRAAIEKAKNENAEYLHEYRVIWPDGSVHWILAKGRCKYDSSGRAVRMLGIVKDITSRKEAEEAQFQSEARFRTIFESIAEAAVFEDTNRCICAINGAAEKLWGYTEEELKGNSMVCLYASQHDYEELGEKCYNLGESSDCSKFELYYRRKDGSIFLAESVGTQVRDSKGNVFGFVGLHRDITDRKRAEEVLMESEIRFRELFESMGSGVAVYEAFGNGEDFVFKDLNKAGERIDKLRREEIIGKKVTDLFPGIKEMGLFAVFQRVWRTGKPEFHPVSLYKDERLNQWLENYVYKLHGGELISVYEDVTERKIIEEQLRDYHTRLRAMAISSLLTEEHQRQDIAQRLHDDIGHKLAMAKFSIETSMNSDKEIIGREFGDALIGEINSMIERVRSLTFELGNPVLTELGLEAALERHLTKEVKAKHRINFEFNTCRLTEISENLTICLFRSVRELLNNCVKYSGANKVVVSIGKDNENLVIIVEDDGRGFDVNEANSRIGKGGTFGLFSVQEQLGSFGGRMKIKSVIGHGSRFEIVVPVHETR